MAISQTLSVGWNWLRQLITTADVALADYTIDSFPVGEDVIWKRPLDANSVKIAVFGTGAENATFAWSLYARPTKGPVELVVSGTGILGALAVVKNPITGAAITALWADTLVITNTGWVQTVAVIDSANDRMAKLSFDAMGTSKLFLEITGIGGEGQATGIAGIIAYV